MLSLAAGLAAFAAMRVALSAGDVTSRDGVTDGRGHRGRHRFAAVILLGLLAGAVALSVVLPEEARARLGSLSAGARTDSYRIGVWKDSLSLAASSPWLGSGFGAYGDALPRFKTGASDVRVEHAENDYVELLCEGGLLGFGLVVVGLVLVLGGAWQRVQEEPHRLSRAIRVGALAGLAALLVHSAFDFNLRIPSNALLVALLLACAIAPLAEKSWSSAAEAAPTVATGTDVNAAGGVSRERSSARRLWLGVCALPLAAASAITALGPSRVPHVDRGALVRATAPNDALRRTLLERDVSILLQRRPADAHAWLSLGWLRLPRSGSEAAALASRARHLDPCDEGGRIAAERTVQAAARAMRRGPAFQSQPRKP